MCAPEIQFLSHVIIHFINYIPSSHLRGPASLSIFLLLFSYLTLFCRITMKNFFPALGIFPVRPSRKSRPSPQFLALSILFFFVAKRGVEPRNQPGLIHVLPITGRLESSVTYVYIYTHYSSLFNLRFEARPRFYVLTYFILL